MSGTGNRLGDRNRFAGEERFAFGAFVAWFAITGAWWALAFAPLPVPEEWLASTRAICFGTLPSGLPDRWGWIMLVLAPASMLVFLCAVWGRPLSRALARAFRRPFPGTLLAVMALLLCGGFADVGARMALASRMADAAGSAAGVETSLEPLPDDYPRGLDPAPALQLVDQHGNAFDLASLRGRPVFLTFAYGHCVTVCPILVNAIRQARERSAEPAPAAVVVTLDPWRDRPSSLPDLAKAWHLDEGEGGYMLSGDVESVVGAAAAFGVEFNRDEKTGQIDHAGLTFVIDPEGRLAYRFLGPPAHWLLEAARRVES
jgi:cytochrome oxidase Cu insertion factor (SCO1/SenC/PrrC family)